ncbi:RDD family protein [Streptomyces thermocoprophilus]|uniref:RDD family protein n=2 Tax=Streptomyces TaxID=1883 RepID=A0ABV5V9X9_9ACTN
MSAPTPAPGDERPREGYYPDPSIPGYVRYWNGSAWVPGTSRPAPTDGEPLAPPPGVRPAQPAPDAGVSRASAAASVEETGPHFFDEDPQPAPETGAQEPASAWTADPARQSGTGTDRDRRVSWGTTPGTDPRLPVSQAPSSPDSAAASPAAQGPAQASGAAASSSGGGEEGESSPGTVVFRRPTAADAPKGDQDSGTMLFRPVPSQGKGAGTAAQGAPDAGASPDWPEAGAGFAAQGPVHAGAGGAAGVAGAAAGAPAAAASGPGFAAGKAAADRAAAQAAPAAGPTAAPVAGPRPGPAAPATPATPGVPHQAAAPAPAAASVSTPLTSGPGGGQASWAQQVHRLAGAGEEQPVAPWKPPVEDVFQAAARRQAAARPAGLGKRLAARLVDTLIVGAVTSAAAVPFGLKTVDHVTAKIDAAKLTGRTVTVWILDSTTSVYLGVTLAVLLLAGILFEALPTARWGVTPGKKLFGLEVRDIEAHEPPSFGAALRRWLVYSVPGLLAVGVVGVVWGLFDRPWRQCWHDKAAHTFVAG